LISLIQKNLIRLKIEFDVLLGSRIYRAKLIQVGEGFVTESANGNRAVLFWMTRKSGPIAVSATSCLKPDILSASA
jgi:hypothetical protein